MSGYSSIQITKLDGARNHLETAMWLFFQDKDAGSIHTLTAAALGVLKGIGKSRSIPDFYEYKNIREDLKSKIIRLLNKPQNFFKHASKDLEEILDFNPELTEIFLLQANGLYFEISKKSSALMLLYNFWFSAKHKEKLKETESEIVNEIEQLLKKIDPNNKRTFLTLLPFFESLITK